MVLTGMRSFLGAEEIPAPMESSGEAFPVLVATIISLRTRDAVTREVARRVLSRAPNPQAMAAMKRSELENLLKPAGFYRRKAEQLKALARMITERHGGNVPRDMNALLELPGVGRKTANFVMGMVFGIPAICVDVHVHRISNRLGLVSTGTPGETEKALEKLFPRKLWIGINHTMVTFGQKVCKPVGPLCGSCPFAASCPSSRAEKA